MTAKYCGNRVANILATFRRLIRSGWEEARLKAAADRPDPDPICITLGYDPPPAPEQLDKPAIEEQVDDAKAPRAAAAS